jgi:nucleotide-binding universal stress UspA family protein
LPGMKTMLVATDFSENARNAFRFARQLAPVLQTELELVHVYGLPEVEMLSGARVSEAVEEWMEAFIASEAKVPVKYQLLQGSSDGLLIRESSRADVEMMVVGAEGGGDIAKKWFGGVAETVARYAHCPVLLVPEAQSFSGFRHILFASDYGAANPSTLDLLTNFASLFRASVHFVHVEKPGEGAAYAPIEQRILDHLFRDGTPAFSFQMTCLHSDKISEGLERYAAQQHIDLLVMVAAQRGFWETLFHQSQTREMIHKSRIPLLVIHTGD